MKLNNRTLLTKSILVLGLGLSLTACSDDDKGVIVPKGKNDPTTVPSPVKPVVPPTKEQQKQIEVAAQQKTIAELEAALPKAESFFEIKTIVKELYDRPEMDTGALYFIVERESKAQTEKTKELKGYLVEAEGALNLALPDDTVSDEDIMWMEEEVDQLKVDIAASEERQGFVDLVYIDLKDGFKGN